MLEQLEQSSCFKDLDSDQTLSIVPFCTRVVLDSGDFLIQEGERDTRDFYLLVSGMVEIVSNDTDLISGEVVLSAEDKDLYGELSWLTGCKRTASARCRGEVEAIKIDGESLMQHLQDHPDVGFKVLHNIAQILSQRMVESDSLIKQLLWNANI